MKLLNCVMSNLVPANAVSRSFLTMILATAALSLAVSCGQNEVEPETAKNDDKGEAAAKKECESKDGYTVELNDSEDKYECVAPASPAPAPAAPAPTPTPTSKQFNFAHNSVDNDDSDDHYADLDFTAAGTTIVMSTSHIKSFSTETHVVTIGHGSIITEIGEITAKTEGGKTTMSMSNEAFAKLVEVANDSTELSEFMIILKVNATQKVTLMNQAAYTFLMAIDDTTAAFDKPFAKELQKLEHAALAVNLELLTAAL